MCPLENEDFVGESNGKQTVFSRAIAACDLDWESNLLQRILKGDEDDSVAWLGKHEDNYPISEMTC